MSLKTTPRLKTSDRGLNVALPSTISGASWPQYLKQCFWSSALRYLTGGGSFMRDAHPRSMILPSHVPDWSGVSRNTMTFALCKSLWVQPAACISMRPLVMSIHTFNQSCDFNSLGGLKASSTLQDVFWSRVPMNSMANELRFTTPKSFGKAVLEETALIACVSLVNSSLAAYWFPVWVRCLTATRLLSERLCIRITWPLAPCPSVTGE